MLTRPPFTPTQWKTVVDLARQARWLRTRGYAREARKLEARIRAEA